MPVSTLMDNEKCVQAVMEFLFVTEVGRIVGVEESSEDRS